MKIDFGAAMRQALELTRSQDLMEATRVIQRALSGSEPAASPGKPSEPPQPSAPRLPPPLNGLRPRGSGGSRRTQRAAANARKSAARASPFQAPRRPLGEVVNLLRHAKPLLLNPAKGRLRKAPTVATPSGGALPCKTLHLRGGRARL